VPCHTRAIKAAATAAVLLLTCYFWQPTAAAQPATASSNTAKSARVQAALKQIRAKENAPGLMGAIATRAGVIASGSDGLRKVGSPAAITGADLVHMGSCTKAMTSVMLATLVADGKLSWNTTLIQALPELARVIHRDYHNITLWQLVSHRGRIPANASNWWLHRNVEIKKRRLLLLAANLKQAPAIKAGDYVYSNLGYMAAGCMAEKLTGQSWEQLIRQRVFKPLGMKHAGFGPPGPATGDTQPWGHVKLNGGWQPRHHDNAAALGPAGTVHCTLADWAKFAALQLPGQPAILDRRSLNYLVTPQAGDYAAGWIVLQRPWARGTVYTHSGSNTMWYATIWVAPKTGRIYMAATNSAGPRAHATVDQAIAAMIKIDTGN